MRCTVLLATAALFASSAFAQSQHHAATSAKASADSDPLLNAMKEELTREQQLLVLPGMQRPYFIQYRLDDVHTYEAIANYGALTRENESHQRAVRVEVRIGDYTTDSSSARGDGAVELAPTDNDPNALRFALWTATDDAYKNALRLYAAKQAALKQYQTPPTANDFSPEKPITKIEPLLTLDLDRAEWKKRVVEASGLYATDPAVKSFAPDVQVSSVNVSAIVVNRYVVNTDGTILRHGYAGYQDMVSVGGQAPDGMQLGRDNGSTSTTAAGLESWPSMRQRVINNLLSYNELRHAPVVEAEDYHGPVLFAGDAAADVFNRLFVPNIEADRPEMGTTARTQGAYQSSLHSLVLPNYINVVDDPMQRTFDGQSLLGAYNVDDEGAPAAPVTLVKDGELVNYDIGREPVKDFPASNGHGRAILAQSARSRAGVVIVKSTQNLTAEQMHAKLIALAKEKNKPVYEVETLGGELMPRVLYRISPDGKRTLVRGAAFDDLDQRALRADIIAAGGKPWVAQSIAPVPETTVVPEILFDDITVKRASQEQQKLPYYAPPALN
ncbi:MAG TPA: metallopeptidase TldD-related protein [Acidobacteriaceae bacterium]|nr:metallopeptidase TldD-related protein [Acidobacteriaceae bacterium]